MNCFLCPRKCGTDRSVNSGYCGTKDIVYIARATAHHWEEPCISGEKGSGTVFFSGCPLHCVYCQNSKISNSEKGRAVSIDDLCEIFLDLQKQGLHNINLVTPTHYSIQIAEALRKSNLQIPVVYNTSGYENENSLDLMNGLVNVYMPDFKYFYSTTAKKYSNAPDYPLIAQKAIKIMYKQVKKPVFKNGLMKSGVIVRHLVLPGHTLEGKRIIEWLYSNFGNDIYISIMNQYTPMQHFDVFPELNRKVTAMEYRDVVKFAEKIGVVNAFLQEGDTAKESFIPDFAE
ncbi:MAG: radical SAM protein [Clostridiales bacterium]|nr:MAG: radical SAM protein [Clostridiales bacterium]